MKKLFMLFLISGLLVACSSTSSYDVKVSDADTVLISGSGVNITKNEYFERLLDNYGANDIINEALTAIADIEVTDQKALDDLVAKKAKTYTDLAKGDLDSYAKKMGYSSGEDFKKTVLVVEAKIELLRDKYINENLESLIKTYQVVSLKTINVDKESEALSLIKEVTSEAIFNQKITDAKSRGQDAGVVTKNTTSLDENMKTKLGTLAAITTDGVYPEPIKLSDGTYMVVYVYNAAHKETKPIVTALSADTEVQESIEGFYLKKYHFTVYDSKIEDAIKKLSSQYIE